VNLLFSLLVLRKIAKFDVNRYTAHVASELIKPLANRMAFESMLSKLGWQWNPRDRLAIPNRLGYAKRDFVPNWLAFANVLVLGCANAHHRSRTVAQRVARRLII